MLGFDGGPAHADCPHGPEFAARMRMVTPPGADSHPNSITSDHEAASAAEWSRLMAAAQTGDRAAYERLLREILPFIRTIVRSQHSTADRIEDAVQDVLLTLHRVRHTYDPARPFAHWLAVLARRRSIDLLRRRSRTGAYEVADDAAYETFVDPRANKEQETREWSAALGSAVAALPKRQREAVQLLRLGEMSLAEASRASGMSIAALKVNLHRAIKTLRKRLAGE
jgi:RNA polymerase sigma-70 factor (ECF subfamily)